MTMYKNLTTVCAAVVLAFGLAACGGGDDDEAMAPVEPAPMEPVEPAPPPPPSDLEVTQGEAADAAAAAMTAASGAEMAASGAETATANIATLQTGGTAAASAAAARAAADDAADAASDAADAAAAAAAATDGSAAEAALRMALDAQESAEADAQIAVDMADAAVEAAMTELHIDGTMKNVGDSSVDADAGTLTAQGDGTMTGFIRNLSRDVNAVTGVPFDQRGVSAEAFTADGVSIPDDTTTNATDVAYVQAVAAGSANIGKVLDTSDDMARLTIITAREGKKDVRVFADRAADNTADGLLTAAGLLPEDIDTGTDGNQTTSVKSIGSYYMAVPPATDTDNVLDAMDVVDPASDPVETVRADWDSNRRYGRDGVCTGYRNENRRHWCGDGAGPIGPSTSWPWRRLTLLAIPTTIPRMPR